MSLINKMLKDLETRERGAASGAPAKPMFDDLHSVNVIRARPAPRVGLWVAGLLLVVSAGGALYFYGPELVREKGPVLARAPAESAATMASIPERVTETTVVAEPVANTESVSKPDAPVGVAVPSPALSVPTEVKLVPRPARMAAADVARTAPPKAPTPPRAAKPAAPPKAAAKSESMTAAQAASSGAVVIEKRDRPVIPQEQAEARYREAALLVSQGRAEDARPILVSALVLFPGHHKARELAAAIAVQNGRSQEAQDLLAQGLRLTPDHLPFSQLRARIFLEQGADAQAIVTLEAARTAGAGNADFLSLLAALYQRSGRHADAVSAYREAVAVRAQDARAWLGLGISLEGTQDVAGASQAYTRALQLGGLDARLAQYAQQRLAVLKK